MVQVIGQPTRVEEVEDQVAVLHGLVARLDPDAVAVPEAPMLWAAFERIERLAAAGRLLVSHQVEASSVWKEAGCRSAAELLARCSGRSVRSARTSLRTSSRLRDCPTVSAALRRGELSEAQTELVTDAASVASSNEEALVGLAGRVSLVERAEECGRIKAAADPDPEATYGRIRDGRRLRQRTDGEGAWCLYGRGPADDGALVNHALGPLIDEQYDRARAEGRREHQDAHRYDAFIALIRRSLALDDPGGRDDLGEAASGPSDHGDHGAIDHSGGQDGTPGSAAPTAPMGELVRSQPPTTATRSSTGTSDGSRLLSPDRTPERRRSRHNPRHLALIRVDLSALVRGHAADRELCEITGIGPVPASVARDLLGDAILKLVVTNGHDVAHVTHLGRGPTAAQRVALLWQRPACTNEACGHRFVEIDHRTQWARTRRTRLDELDPLCPHCHRLKTYERWSLVEGRGRRAFIAPDDPRHPRTKRRSQAA